MNTTIKSETSLQGEPQVRSSELLSALAQRFEEWGKEYVEKSEVCRDIGDRMYYRGRGDAYGYAARELRQWIADNDDQKLSHAESAGHQQRKETQ